MIKARVSDAALSTFALRYYAKAKKETTPDEVFRRCSGGKKEYYDLLSSLYFLPNSPTLFNLGLKNGNTLSACFVFDFDDSLRDGPRSIMATIDKAAAVAKAGGGVGYYFGNLRGEGSLVRGNERVAAGPVKVLFHCQSLRNFIRQGSKRDLAQMGVNDAHHPDADKWIDAKLEDPQALESFNLSLSWRDEYMREVEKGHDSPTPNAWRTRWDRQCRAAWAVGCPGTLFWDTINRANATPHLGNINGTNPCGETPNLCDEPCNLGSIAVCRFWDPVGKQFEWKELSHYIDLSIRYLDDVLDWNEFPHPDITKAATLTRKLGLGVMGLADLFAMMGIHYDSQDAVDWSSELSRFINGHALTISKHLASVKGAYPAWQEGTKYPQARNSTRTSIAPTGTISILAGVSSSIEPYYALEGERTTFEGVRLPDGVPDWVQQHIPPDHIPKEADDIHWSWHVKHQAAWQKNVDLGVSKTINMPNIATVEDISAAYLTMWKTGCKGGTIYRKDCRKEQVIRKKRDSVYEKSSTVQGVALPAIEKPPQKAPQRPRVKFSIGDVRGYLHITVSDDNTKPLELFLRFSQCGSTIQGMLDAWAMAISHSLQRGMPLADIVRHYTGIRFEPCGLTNVKEVPICTSLPDFIVRYLEHEFKNGANTPPTPVPSGHLCPECGTECAFVSGCLTCTKSGCGWSRCG